MKKDKREFTRIFRRIILVFVLSSVISAFVVSLALYYILSQMTLNNWKQQQEFVTLEFAPQCDFEIEEAQKQLEFLAKLPVFSNLLHIDQIDPAVKGVPENIDVEKREILRELLASNKRFTSTFILTPNGDLYLAEPFKRQGKVKRQNFLDRPYFKEASQTKRPVISNSFLGASGILLVVVVVPVLDKTGGITSYLGGATYLTDLSRLVAKDRIGNFDSAFIVDRNGSLIAHSDIEKVKKQSRKDYAEHPMVLKYLRKGRGGDLNPAIEDYVNPMDGKEYLSSFVRLQSGWGLGLDIEKETVLSKIFPVVWGITILTSIIILAVCVIGILFVHRIGRRWEVAEKDLRGSLKEKETLLKEIHHRVKNNMNVTASLLKLQAARVTDKKVLEIFKDTRERINAMALVHDKLYRSKDVANIDLKGYVEDLVESQFRSYGGGKDRISLKIAVDELFFDIDLATPCGLIVSELVSNALKHAFPQNRKGEIKVALSAMAGDEFELIVSDDGVGFPADVDFENSESFGLYLIKLLIEQLEGTVDLDRDGGTAFRIRFRK